MTNPIELSIYQKQYKSQKILRKNNQKLQDHIYFHWPGTKSTHMPRDKNRETKTKLKSNKRIEYI